MYRYINYIFLQTCAGDCSATSLDSLLGEEGASQDSKEGMDSEADVSAATIIDVSACAERSCEEQQLSATATGSVSDPYSGVLRKGLKY